LKKYGYSALTLAVKKHARAIIIFSAWILWYRWNDCLGYS